MKVLIVDDSKAMRMIVMRQMRQAGFDDGVTYVVAENGEEALGAIRQERPDVVLSDWNMPEMTGIELLTTLRESGDDVAFGFVTSESSAEMRERALSAGAAFLVTKPFTPESLRSAVDGARGARR